MLPTTPARYVFNLRSNFYSSCKFQKFATKEDGVAAAAATATATAAAAAFAATTATAAATTATAAACPSITRHACHPTVLMTTRAIP